MKATDEARRALRQNRAVLESPSVEKGVLRVQKTLGEVAAQTKKEDERRGKGGGLCK